MTADTTQAARWRAAILAAILVAGGGGYWLGQRGSDAPASASGKAARTSVTFRLKRSVLPAHG